MEDGAFPLLDAVMPACAGMTENESTAYRVPLPLFPRRREPRGLCRASALAGMMENERAVYRLPNRRSMSASLSSIQVGRPWLHWPE